MEKTMEITITCKDTIKPSSPTPLHLRSYKLSLLDQLSPAVFQPILLFYLSNDIHPLEMCRLLRESLPTFLTHYYPFAGRLNGNVSVECNDEGAYYSEAEATFPLVEIIKGPDSEAMQRLFPPEPREQGRDDPLFLVQITVFKCGGLSLGVCMSHKFSDGASATAVISAWADFARRDRHTNGVVPALFSPASVFQPIDNFPTQKTFNTEDQQHLVSVSRRFVFKNSSIASMKAMAASEEVPHPSRVEVISALLWKHTIRALRLKSGVHRPLSIIWPVSIRGRLVPPMGPRTFGNIAIPMVMESQDESDGEVKLSKLVSLMRGGVAEIDNKYRREMETKELMELIIDSYTEVGKAMEKSGEIDFHGHTSWCKFPLYEADFGWGKPAWVTIGYIKMANTVVIMDSKDADEVEAWVSFKDEEDRHIFENDQELLEFASLNPHVD